METTIRRSGSIQGISLGENRCNGAQDWVAKLCPKVTIDSTPAAILKVLEVPARIEDAASYVGCGAPAPGHWQAFASLENLMRLDLSAPSIARVYVLTIAGTVLCIAASLAFDSFSFASGSWRWGSDPLNNVLIPGLLAPPLLFALLSQTRQLALAHRELLTIASTDSLTNVLNRRAYTAIVEGYLASLDGADREGALLVIDVDFFKLINDRFGHDKGDEALTLVASTIKTTLRPGDVVARMGGEEFSVFLPGTALDEAVAVGERIRFEIAMRAFSIFGEAVALTASIGGIVFPCSASFSELYRAADQQMYLAKRRGRNQVSINTQLAVPDPQPSQPYYPVA